MQLTVPTEDGGVIEFECADTFVSRRINHEILVGKTYPFLPFVPDVRVVLDVGASCGAASVHLARHYPDAEVHSFEPASQPLAHLRRNAAGFGNVHVHEFGLHAADQQLLLHYGTGESVAASVVRVDEPGGSEMVQLRAAGGWAADHGIDRIDILKVDVAAGAGVAVIASLAPLLPTVKVLYVEYDSRDARHRLAELVEPTHELYIGVMFIDQGECLYLRKDLADHPEARPTLLRLLRRDIDAPPAEAG